MPMLRTATITGTGMCVPPRVVTNDDLAKVMDTSDEWIVQRTGIKERRHVDAGTGPKELALAAANRALTMAGRNARDITCECERSNQPSLVQVLNLANGSTLNDRLAAKTGRITQLLATEPEPPALVTDAWWRCLGRPPTDAERKPFEEMLAAVPAAERREIVEDMYWSLLTSREFLFRH